MTGVSDSEQAAIAGMFKAAADDWQVTQEVMSQCVLNISLLLYTYSFKTGNSAFILRRGLGVVAAVQVQGRQEHPDDSINTQSPRDQYLLGISATDVVRKVGVRPNCLAFSNFRLGHWIQDCPTNNDPEYDKKRIKRTTGIPRSFLKSVEPTEGAPLAQGVMVTPDGGYVIAQPDT